MFGVSFGPLLGSLPKDWEGEPFWRGARGSPWLALGGPWLGGLGPGPLAWGGPWPGGPWPGGPWPGGGLGRPLARGPLARGALGPGRLGRGALGRGWGALGLGPLQSPWVGGGGPLGWGALGPGGPFAGGQKSESPQNHEIEQPACLDPSPASWSRNPAARGQGAPGGGARQTLNPKPPEAKGYDSGLYFSYAKGGLGAGHPLAEY